MKKQKGRKAYRSVVKSRIDHPRRKLRTAVAAHGLSENYVRKVWADIEDGNFVYDLDDKGQVIESSVKRIGFRYASDTTDQKRRCQQGIKPARVSKLKEPTQWPWFIAGAFAGALGTSVAGVIV